MTRPYRGTLTAPDSVNNSPPPYPAPPNPHVPSITPASKVKPGGHLSPNQQTTNSPVRNTSSRRRYKVLRHTGSSGSPDRTDRIVRRNPCAASAETKNPAHDLPPQTQPPSSPSAPAIEPSAPARTPQAALPRLAASWANPTRAGAPTLTYPTLPYPRRVQRLPSSGELRKRTAARRLSRLGRISRIR